MRVGFHASHEQFAPAELLDLTCRAEAAGFQAGMSADHLAPWSERQGESGFAWLWLGAALRATDLPFGVVTAPGQRYHPVITAQAIATAAAMYPGRFWAAIGSGHAMNEHVTGDAWPSKQRRNRRLSDCVAVIRSLLAGETVDVDRTVRVSEARLWTLPDTPPPLFGAPLTPETATEVATWADGMITINMPDDQLRAIIDAFRSNGGEGKPIYLQVHLSWAPSEDEALAQAYDQWRTNVIAGGVAEEIRLPQQFDAIAEHVRPEALRGPVLVSSDLGWHAEQLARFAQLGVETLFLHNVGRNQAAFIDAFAERVLPAVVSSG